ncbi:voltage-dependent T-type calcium channel subunit alpha-1I-like [Oncorhynchus kisutch]|uniref:voltage-dependent T-type calcium channel subunit alpha-1I-like n=1 Tax=Oncorhynchus kisutch TaxID=8019 RepID=UPI0012DE54F0|nr:voltage-dependent T-type calcium channel subunit alpha-1I-like [Oncorhynchus kisutch]
MIITGCSCQTTNAFFIKGRVWRESQWLDSVSLLIKDSFEGEMLMIDNLSGSVFHHYSSTSSPVWKDYKGNLQEESQWLDSVSLLIKDSFEGEMLMIDNLSGSVFHHYSSTSSPVWKDYKGNLQEIQLAEVEQASLMSEQLSDKSSSLALPDDLSLDDHSDYQLLVRDGKEERGSSDSHSSEELRGIQAGCGGRWGHGGSRPHSRGPEDGVGFLLEVGAQPQFQSQSLQYLHHNRDNNCTSTDGDGHHSDQVGSVGCRGSSSPLFHLPVEFFHPTTATAVPPPIHRMGVDPGGREASRLPSPASWSSLRSPGANSSVLDSPGANSRVLDSQGAKSRVLDSSGANSRVLVSQHPSHSDSSLATGSSEGSLQTTLEEGLSFSVSPPRVSLALPLLCPLPLPHLDETRQTPRSLGHPSMRGRSTIFNLQATRGHQRSQSSCGSSTSPGCPRQDSMDPSDDDCGIGMGGEGSSQAFNSERLSETLSSLSLTSLLSPSSLAPPLVKKCNSTGSLDQANLSVRSKDGQQYYEIDAHGYLTNPWTEKRGGQEGEMGFGVKGTSQMMDAGSRKNR